MQGTMSHMAPEALLRGHISKAADVYSFGITLWELFTGCHAYFGKAAFAWVCAGRQGCAFCTVIILITRRFTKLRLRQFTKSGEYH
jgi:serine/threonine protein kinase